MRPGSQMQKHSGGPTCCRNGCPGLWDFRAPAWQPESMHGDPWLAGSEEVWPSARGAFCWRGNTDLGRNQGWQAYPRGACYSCPGWGYYCPPCCKAAPPTVASWGTCKAPNMLTGLRKRPGNDFYCNFCPVLRVGCLETKFVVFRQMNAAFLVFRYHVGIHICHLCKEQAQCLD